MSENKIQTNNENQTYSAYSNMGGKGTIGGYLIVLSFTVWCMSLKYFQYFDSLSIFPIQLYVLQFETTFDTSHTLICLKQQSVLSML